MHDGDGSLLTNAQMGSEKAIVGSEIGATRDS
jgi:tRNA U34 5-carboxymethylaminomethyl modifying GTPase MnmE/TrmE